MTKQPDITALTEALTTLETELQNGALPLPEAMKRFESLSKEVTTALAALEEMEHSLQELDPSARTSE